MVMQKIVKTIGLVPFIFLICIGQVYAQEGSNELPYRDYIFQVTASGCKGKESKRSLTGFLIKQEGKSFIATALHGVIGCESWEANIVGGKRHEGLEIAQVDIPHDVALLGFGQNSDPYGLGEGLVVERNLPKENDRDVIIRGYPKQSQLLIPYELRITEFITTTLRYILTRSEEYESALNGLKVRESPHIDKKVLYLQGVLVPGYSGAPVFNSEGHVIGIANGGLWKAEDVTAWAIPWQIITPIEVGRIQEDYDNLKDADVSPLLSSAVFSQNDPALLNLRQLDLTFIDKTGSPQAPIRVQVFEGIETWYPLPLSSQNIDLALVSAIKIAENDVPIADGNFKYAFLSRDEKLLFRVDTRFGFPSLHVKPNESSSACAFKVKVREQGKTSPLDNVRAEITLIFEKEAPTYLGVQQADGGYLFNFVCKYPVTVELELSHDLYQSRVQEMCLSGYTCTTKYLKPILEYDKCRDAPQGYFVREGDTLWDIAEEKGLAKKFREVTKKLFEIANEKHEEDPKSYAAISDRDRLQPRTCIYIATENEITKRFATDAEINSKIEPSKQTSSVAELAPTIPWLPLNEDKIPSIYYYGFNLKEPPFNNSIIRQAFSLAVDRKKIVGIAPEQRPATTFTPPDVLGRDLYGEVGLPFNPDKASALLADAGYAEGQSFPQVTLAYMKDRANEAVAKVVVDMWQDHLGVNVKLQSFDNFEDYKELLDSDHPPSIFLMIWAADYTDPDNFLNTTFQKNRVPGGGQFNNDDFNRKVLEAEKKPEDPPSRQDLYVKAEQILVEQEAAVIPIFHFYFYRNQR